MLTGGFMVLQWLEFCAFTARVTGLISGQIKILQAEWP